MKRLTYIVALLLVAGCTKRGEPQGPQPQPEPAPEPGVEVVVPTFGLTIRHSMSYLCSPEWRGDAPQGSVDWGDGTMEEYREGVEHRYTADGKYEATFEMTSVDGFEIKQLGDIEHLNIAL